MQFTYVFYFFEFFLKIFLQENLHKIVLKQNKSNLATRLCRPDDVMTTVMTSVISPGGEGGLLRYKRLMGMCRWMGSHFHDWIDYTVEPRFNEPLFNEVFDITNDILGPGQSYSEMYGIEPRYNEPRYNEFFDITNIIRKPERRIYLDITNYNVNTRQKINAELINSQQIL